MARTNDGLILWYPGCESHAMQGVTSFVGYQCGSSPTPIACTHGNSLEPRRYPKGIKYVFINGEAVM